MVIPRLGTDSGRKPLLFAPALPPFSPLDIPNLAFWYDASDASTLFADTAGTVPAATSIAYWQDKSGNGLHAVQHNAPRRPSTGRMVSGLNALDFAGSHQLRPPNGALALEAVTLFIAHRPDTANQTQQIICVTGNGGMMTRCYNLNQACDYGNTQLNASGPVSGSTLIQVSSVSGGAGARTQRLHVGGGAGFSGAVTRSGVNSGNWSIGCFDSAGSLSTFYDGALCEIIGVRRECSAAEKNQVAAYLMRWGAGWTDIP